MCCAALSASAPPSKCFKMPLDFSSMSWLTHQGQSVIRASSSAADLSTAHAEKDIVSMPAIANPQMVKSYLLVHALHSMLCRTPDVTSLVEQTFWHSVKHSVQVMQLLGAARSLLARLAQHNRKHIVVQHSTRIGLTLVHKGSQKTNSISPPYNQDAP